MEKPPPAASGDAVALVDGRGRFQGKAFWSERSQISIRLLTREEEPIDEDFFARRIASAAGLRRRAFGEETLWRAVHGESDLLPGLVADRYGDVGVIQTLVPGTERRKELLAALLAKELGLRAVLERNDVRVRELEGLAQVKGVLVGAGPRPGGGGRGAGPPSGSTCSPGRRPVPSSTSGRTTCAPASTPAAGRSTASPTPAASRSRWRRGPTRWWRWRCSLRPPACCARTRP